MIGAAWSHQFRGRLLRQFYLPPEDHRPNPIPLFDLLSCSIRPNPPTFLALTSSCLTYASFFTPSFTHSQTPRPPRLQGIVPQISEQTGQSGQYKDGQHAETKGANQYERNRSHHKVTMSHTVLNEPVDIVAENDEKGRNQGSRNLRHVTECSAPQLEFGRTEKASYKIQEIPLWLPDCVNGSPIEWLAAQRIVVPRRRCAKLELNPYSDNRIQTD